MDATLHVIQRMTSNRVCHLPWHSATAFFWINLPGILIKKDKITDIITVQNSHSDEEFTAIITDQRTGESIEFCNSQEDTVVNLMPDVCYVLEITTTRNAVFGNKHNSPTNYKEEQKTITIYTINFNPE